MNTLKIFNIYQADFLIKNNCTVAAAGIEGKIYIEFIKDNILNEKMEVWQHRKH